MSLGQVVIQLLRDRFAPYFFTQPNAEAVVMFRFTVPIAGQPQQLPDFDIPDGYGVVIKAMDTNSGTTYLGYSQGTAAKKAGVSFRLLAGKSVTLRITTPKRVWIDEDTSGDGVELIVEQ